MTAARLRIPGYEILDQVGKGAMGIVYKARQTSVDRIVAIKVLRDDAARDKEFIARFRREATVAAKLSHNNIVNAIDAGSVDDHHYFVMEFVEGTNVQDELDKGKVYPEAAAVRIVRDIARALEHAHARGLIHRDIKPGNIILTAEGETKLADLGLARMTTDAKAAAAEAGKAAGTPYYISPEQARGLTDIDIRADLYSLGATLYHMVTGRVPYEGANPKEVMRKHVSKKFQFTPADHVNTSLSNGLAEVIEMLMAKGREDRYARPEDLIFDLDGLLRGERPSIAHQKHDALALLSQGDLAADVDDLGIALDEGPLAASKGGGDHGFLVVVLSILLALSVLMNIVQLVAR